MRAHELALAGLAALGLVTCHTPAPPAAPEASATVEAHPPPGGADDESLAAVAGPEPPMPPRPDPPSASWGEPAAKYAACPRALCSDRSSAAESIRGCEPDATEPATPPAIAVEPAQNECPPSPSRARSGRAPSLRVGSASVGGSGGGGGGSTVSGFGLGSVGTMGHGHGTGNGVGFGRGSGGLARGPSVGGGSVSYPMALSAGGDASSSTQAYAGTTAGGDTPTISLSAADELIIVARRPEREDGGEDEERDGRTPTQGTLRAKSPDGDEVGEFPLRHTEVRAELGGTIGRTVVEQIYGNPFAEVIEALYVFPLPTRAAVNDFVMEVRGRKIVGLIRPREEAERIYVEARERGQTASLLTQERPNVFTQSVANIEPGGEVRIRITYLERLVYDRGRYEWVFPMVVGPRYVPGTPTPSASASASGPSSPTGGLGWAAPTDRVPDADRITPPVLRPGERSGHDIGLTVSLDAGLPIRELQAVTHCVDIEEFSDARTVVRLAAGDGIPNRDFVLRWGVSGDETQFGVLAHRGALGGYFTLMMQPPLQPSDEQVVPREISFVIDVSGSQMGLPLGISKEIVRRTLDELRPEDAFNIYYFASGNGQLWSRPRERNARNVGEAREFLDALCGGGGTEMLDGLRRALRGDHDPKYLQMVVFLTDGYVGNEAEILRLVREERGEARFFAFGIGSSVNRYLVDGVGEFGGGASHVVLPRDADHAGKAVARLFELIDSPVLVDVEIDWNGLPVEEVYPRKLPDLFAGGTIAVVGRFSAAARGTAYVVARRGVERLRLPVEVDLPAAEEAHAALAPIWARWRIAELSAEMIAADGEQRRGELQTAITDLAVDFRLVSDFTAFVAVDESRTVGTGRWYRVGQPVEMPEGVSHEGIFGPSPAGERLPDGP